MSASKNLVVTIGAFAIFWACVHRQAAAQAAPVANANGPRGAARPVEVAPGTPAGQRAAGSMQTLNLAQSGNVAASQAGANGCASLPSGAVSWWKGEGNADDSIGSNDGALLNGASIVAGHVGDGFLFDGVDDVIEVPSDPSLSPVDAMTVTAWVRVDQTVNVPGIVSKYDDTLGNRTGWELSLGNGFNTPYFRIGYGSSSGAGVGANTAIGDGQFHHVAASFDAGILKIYVDGALEDTLDAPFLGTAFVPNSVPMKIGDAGGFRYHNGAIDEVLLFDRALSDTEILAMFNAGTSGSCFDCNLNGVPDEDELAGNDCNSNGSPDLCDVRQLVDDGGFELVWGSSGNVDILYLNQFIVEPGKETLYGMEILWNTTSNGVPEGTPVVLGIWSDPDGDGDPADAVPLTLVTTSVAFNTEPLTFVTYASSLLETNLGTAGDSYFVGCWLEVTDQYPMGVDITVVHNRSYAGTAAVGTIDGTSVVVFPTPANHMIRPIVNDCDASGIPDTCDPDCDGNGRPDLCDIRECNGDPACFDCDGNGLPDACDLASCEYVIGCVPPSASAVSQWKGEADGSDSIGTNDATLSNGATTGAAFVGNGFLLDGLDDEIRVADSPTLQQSSAITVEGWVRADGGFLQNAHIASKWQEPAVSEGWILEAQELGPAGFCAFTTSDALCAVGTTDIQDGEFHHVAGTFDGTELRVYIDGVLDASVAHTGTIITNAAPLSIGSNAYENAQFFEGAIDELTIHDAALTDVEIAAIFGAGGSGICSGDSSCLDCNGNGVPDGCDIDGGEPDNDENGIPDVCECLPTDAPLAVLPNPENRYLTIEPRNAGGMTALRVSLDQLHVPDPPVVGSPDFGAFNGQVRWVGPPAEYPEGSTPTPTFFAAQLQCEPHFADWSAFGTVSVYGDAVVPSSSYTIQAIDESCTAAIEDEASYSAGLPMITSRWADVAEPFQPPSPFTQPNITDILLIVDKFLGQFPPLKSSAQLLGNVPDPNVKPDINDILLCVDAFLGRPYPYSGPVACP